MTAESLSALVARVRDCRLCSNDLPLGPKPILQVSEHAPILIASQAPGTKAHMAGQTFLDASGDRLREWLSVSTEQFYDPRVFAILPMGMCYPGRLPQGGDRPPRPECAPRWRDEILSHLRNVRLTLLVGSYSQIHVLGRGRMTERVRHYRDYLPSYFPLPHPSWRTGGWEKRNPWFQSDVIPALRTIVHGLIDAVPSR